MNKLRVLFSIILLCIISNISFATEFLVPSQYATIAAAMTAASNVGDIITVSSGTYVLSAPITFKSGIILRSVSGAAATIIQAPTTGTNKRCFITNTALVDGTAIGQTGKGFTFENGSMTGTTANAGGCINFTGGNNITGAYNVNIVDCIFQNNTVITTATSGSNYARGGAIAINSSDDVDISGCTFTNNTAVHNANNGASQTGASAGGAIWITSLNSSATISNCTFSYNKAKDVGTGVTQYDDSNRSNGGAIFLIDFFGTISNCTFSADSASVGGAIGDLSTPLLTTTPVITTCTFTDCFSGSSVGGGAIYFPDVANVIDPTYNIVDCVFTNNESIANGGAIYSSKPMKVTGCSFAYNTGTGGGAIYQPAGESTDSLDFNDCLFNSNIATSLSTGLGGGAICYRNANALSAGWKNLTLVKNESYGGGGAIISTAPFSLTKSIVAFNKSYVTTNTQAIKMSGAAGIAVLTCMDAYGNTAGTDGTTAALGYVATLCTGTCLTSDPSFECFLTDDFDINTTSPSNTGGACGVLGSEALASADATAPSAISDLALTCSTTYPFTITLTWTSPGDDAGTYCAAKTYDIRYSQTAISSGNFSTRAVLTQSITPKIFGNMESIQKTGIDSLNTTYYFAIKSSDEVPNTSTISNLPSITTPVVDTDPPQTITTLAISGMTSTTISLTWTAPYEDSADNTSGAATNYVLKRSTSAITNDSQFNAATSVGGLSSPAAPGTNETATATGLTSGITYYFAIKAYDGNSNASSLSNNPHASTVETTAPTAISDLSIYGVNIGTSTSDVTLSWTSTGDDGATGTATYYDLRASRQQITSSTFSSDSTIIGEPSPKIAGQQEFFTINGLRNNTTYYFAIKAVDDQCNTSTISNIPYIQGTGDTTPPADVTNLTVTQVANNVIRLRWTAPGDDGNTGTAYGYDIRYRTGSAINSGNFGGATQVTGEPSPKTAGSSELVILSNLVTLAQETTYYVAFKTYDEAGNTSGISNVISFTTEDITNPGTIADLSATSLTTNTVTMEWTAPGDDGTDGTATSYDIRYIAGPIMTFVEYGTSAIQITNEPTPQVSGTNEVFTITGLSAATQYSIGIVVYDEAGNNSDLSNILTVTTLADQVVPPKVTDLTTCCATHKSIIVYWTSPLDGGTSAVQYFDLRYSTSLITEQNFGSANLVLWSQEVPDPGDNIALIVSGLNATTTYYFAVKSVDLFGNTSLLSNVASATTTETPVGPSVGTGSVSTSGGVRITPLR